MRADFKSLFESGPMVIWARVDSLQTPLWPPDEWLILAFAAGTEAHLAFGEANNVRGLAWVRCAVQIYGRLPPTTGCPEATSGMWLRAAAIGHCGAVAELV